MKQLSIIVLLGVLLVAGCNAGDPGPPPPPVVVYASPEHESSLTEAFSAFTAATRIPVTLKIADSVSNTRNVINNEGTPPADVLVTSTVIDVWRAADEGALRPLTSPTFAAVPSVLKDPDGMWAAIGVRFAVIGVAPGASDALADAYGDLASSDLRGKVCVSSSVLPVNRTLIAMLIEDIGVKPAERMARAWVRNLAASPFATETKLVDALRSGACQYGVVSSSIDLAGLSTITPQPLYADIDGIGVARHARQAESAQTLVDWLLAENPLAESGSSNGKNLALAGWHDEEVRLLVERAGYR